MTEGDTSFLALLLKKLSFTKDIQSQTGKITGAAQNEVKRQIEQVSIKGGGDPKTGRGVTKSGGND